MKNPFKYLGSLLVGLIIILILILKLPNGSILISFLNIGQGDAIYIRTPDDYHILIDGGPSVKILEELADIMPLYNRTIDILILTHPHSDHVNGLVEILKRFSVRNIIIVGTPYNNPYYQKFLELINEYHINLYFADSSNDIKLGRDVYIDIVWPVTSKAGIYFENVNNTSIALKLLFNNHKILLTGDAEIEEEREIIESGFEISADILKSGHHGSRTASLNEFLSEVNAKIAVIQSGEENDFGHPHKETLRKYYDRNMLVKRNDLEGRIDFIFSQ